MKKETPEHKAIKSKDCAIHAVAVPFTNAPPAKINKQKQKQNETNTTTTTNKTQTPPPPKKKTHNKTNKQTTTTTKAINSGTV